MTHPVALQRSMEALSLVQQQLLLSCEALHDSEVGELLEAQGAVVGRVVPAEERSRQLHPNALQRSRKRPARRPKLPKQLLEMTFVSFSATVSELDG